MVVGPTQLDGCSLAGADQAAVLLLSLPTDQVGKLMGLLDEAEIRAISRAMSQLGYVEPTVTEGVLHAFLTAMSGGAALVGSPQIAERLLRSAFVGQDKLVDSIMADIHGAPPGNIWEQIGAVDPQQLSDYLANEHPQTAAVVLSNLIVEQAARVLALLPEDFAAAVVQRLLTLGPINQDALEDVERALMQDLVGTASAKKHDAFAHLAELVSLVDADTQARLLSSLEAAEPEGAAKVRKLVFTFPDLARLSAPAIQALFQDCDKARLTVALRGADEATREAFFRNMPQRQAKALREELEQASTLRKSDIEAAQQEVVLLAKALASANLISLEPE